MNEETNAANPLFEEIDVSAIPKKHRRGRNPLYDKILNKFMMATSKAIRVECRRFASGSERILKPLSIAQSFRMKIQERKLAIKVQLDDKNGFVYLIKSDNANAQGLEHFFDHLH